MKPLKEKIINYILKFISERDREVRVSDLYDFIEREFASDLQEECKNVPLSDGIYIDSTIRETGIMGSVLLIIFRSPTSLCFISCFIRISLNLKND